MTTEEMVSRSAGPLGTVLQAVDEAGARKVFAAVHPDEPLPTSKRAWDVLYARILATTAGKGATEVEIVRSALVERGKLYVVDPGGRPWTPSLLSARGPGATRVPAIPEDGPSRDGGSPATPASSGAG